MKRGLQTGRGGMFPPRLPGSPLDRASARRARAFRRLRASVPSSTRRPPAGASWAPRASQRNLGFALPSTPAPLATPGCRAPSGFHMPGPLCNFSSSASKMALGGRVYTKAFRYEVRCGGGGCGSPSRAPGSRLCCFFSCSSGPGFHIQRSSARDCTPALLQHSANPETQALCKRPKKLPISSRNVLKRGGQLITCVQHLPNHLMRTSNTSE